MVGMVRIAPILFYTRGKSSIDDWNATYHTVFAIYELHWLLDEWFVYSLSYYKTALWFVFAIHRINIRFKNLQKEASSLPATFHSACVFGFVFLSRPQHSVVFCSWFNNSQNRNCGRTASCASYTHACGFHVDFTIAGQRERKIPFDFIAPSRSVPRNCSA